MQVSGMADRKDLRCPTCGAESPFICIKECPTAPYRFADALSEVERLRTINAKLVEDWNSFAVVGMTHLGEQVERLAAKMGELHPEVERV